MYWEFLGYLFFPLNWRKGNTSRTQLWMSFTCCWNRECLSCYNGTSSSVPVFCPGSHSRIEQTFVKHVLWAGISWWPKIDLSLPFSEVRRSKKGPQWNPSLGSRRKLCEVSRTSLTLAFPGTNSIKLIHLWQKNFSPIAKNENRINYHYWPWLNTVLYP